MKSAPALGEAVELETVAPGRTSVSERQQTIKHADRNPALDFTKGALVLIMVLYHWLNYFYQAPADVYKYLRFLTPSFICITGFLISNVYISKYGIADRRLPYRLFQRGIKILGVFVALNIIRTFFLSDPAQIVAEHSSLRSLVELYVIGNGGTGGQAKSIAFFVLVPISYLLLLSSLLLVVCRFYKNAFYAVCVAIVLAVFALELRGFQSTNLELIAIGLLGVICGYTPVERVNAMVRHPLSLAVGYACYVAAITVWNVIYPLQIVGVFLSLMIIYSLADISNPAGVVRSRIILLGKYSLFGYIAQIAVLQCLHGGLRYLDLGTSALLISFLAACTLTILAVEVVDWARGVTMVDKLYKAVFA